MEDTKNAVVTAKALITESLGMLNYGDITPDEHMKNLNKAKKVLTPKQIQTTLAQFSNQADIPEVARKPKQNKGGLSKKPKFMKGGSYKGKSHMYAAGGMVKELKI
tara:strand:- start:395 stop:712 length:318 start_codon:yes stop_codon:yes gene_type:complete